MISVFIVITVFCILYVIFNYKNKITRAFASYLTGIGVLLFSSLMYFTKLTSYPISTKLDYYLYILLMNIKLNIPDISRIYNIGVALILFTTVLLVTNISKLRKSAFAVMILPILYFLWVNDPITTYNYYLDISLGKDMNPLLILVKYKNYINLGIIVVYMLMPFISLFRYYTNTSIKLKKRSTLITAIWLLTIDLYTVFVFISGTYSVFFATNLNHFKFPEGLVFWNSKILVPLTLFIVILLLFLVYYYKPFNNFSRTSDRKMKQNYKVLSKNFRMLFHVYKNLFFTIDRLAEQGLSRPELGEKNFGKIREISGESVATITRMLDMMRDIKFQFEKISITECIDKACESITLPDGIKIVKKYSDNSPDIYADKIHFTEVFKNIINNSVDAIQLKKETADNDFEGCIEITVSSEDDMQIIEIEDNGNGIEKENLKNIYKPLFSTKQSVKNWGIGLNYVRNVINIHNGNITASSESGEYTRFEILLPISTERNIKKYEKNKISHMR